MGNWLETETAGAPFVITEEVNYTKWNSVSDYGTACAVKRYIERISVRGENVLVLGDESLPLRFMTDDDGAGIDIVRWVYAPNELAIEGILRTLDYRSLPILESTSITWHTSELVLFDSLKGHTESDSNCLKISTKGKYWDITTMEYKTDDVYLIIHRIAAK